MDEFIDTYYCSKTFVRVIRRLVVHAHKVMSPDEKRKITPVRTDGLQQKSESPLSGVGMRD